MNQKARDKKAISIFLSYAMEDSGHAQKLKILLSQRPEVRVFTGEMLSAGENWSSRIKDELQKCNILMVILSPTSVNSSWVLHEIGAAWAMGKQIVALATDPTVALFKPVALGQYPLMDIDELEKPDKLNQILKAAGKATITASMK
jgi:hypothetical protein